ncbi:MAG: dihydroxy-acid dehydratase [Chloroflexi bacterium]|nr:dihydroxy-acid dehydratase [Chloroflexota bacterium]MCL5110212.1 dihydroxy-acid dehydratase [Chloroflexota bacterium]
MRSDILRNDPERAPHRSLMRALGLNDRELAQPLVGIVNSYSEIIPGHAHLRQIADAVKAGVRMAGGTPLEFNTIGICDGIAMGHQGMYFSLPSREIIADSIELVAQGHPFDALVFVPNCDKIVPGMLMAALRLNLPSVFVSGGPMLAGHFQGEAVSLSNIFQAVGQVMGGSMTMEELDELERVACPGCGSCAGLYTANTMNCLTEALGLGLPGNGTVPAVYGARLALAKDAGGQVVENLKNNLRPRDIITDESLCNAFVVDMALGGSTNSVLHLLAVAHEAGITFPLASLNEISAAVPQVCKIAPAGKHHIEDLFHAGGIQAVMKRVASQLNLDVPTANGRSLRDNLEVARIRDDQVIRTLDNAYSAGGGLAILFGSLAPDGAVVKKGAMDPRMLQHRGPAKPFDDERAAIEAMAAGKIVAGDVVIIRYEGPRGGPGMREMLTSTSILSGLRLDDKVALITDGRFSGASRGAAIGHVSPEAALRGPIAAVQEGDIVSIDVPGRRLDVDVAEAEIQKRLAALPEFEPRVKTGYLRRYARYVTSASTGAVFSEG